MNISYEHYRIFYYVAKYGSFTRAANALMNGQPNITRSMNLLEHELGCRLFTRSNRGVRLTPEGQKLYEHVASAVARLETAEETLRRECALESGLVSLGATETALYGLLLQKLREFHTVFPGVRFRISNHSTPQAVDALKDALVDFAVVTTPTDVTRPLVEIPLISYREILTGGPGFAFLAEQTQHLSELTGYSFVGLGPHTKSYEFFHRYYQDLHLALQPELEAATADQVLLMIKNNLGIGFLPEGLAEDALQKREICQIPVYEELPERQICLVVDTERTLSIAAQKLLGMLRQGQDCITKNSAAGSSARDSLYRELS
ncbi:LysR family transcriptional regulator [Diplocloster modestus]|uniref:LysR family transcriptional regulator n=1 Tax=Diplocloster modestus TaxID=2850322 RepID=A0ABS6KBH4_9FIRM|nr:LysR family transcriptional regulator [Diplocloster modestus]MBU9727853.1 LysR family transcriptional regulator [Diplocloster modestus]